MLYISCIVYIHVEVFEMTKNMEIDNDNLSIDTFYMEKDEYNALSEVNRNIAHKYIDSIANGTKTKSKATVKYNVSIIRFMLRNVVNELNNLTIDDIDSLILGINSWKKFRGNVENGVADSTKKQYYIGMKRFLFWYAKRYKKPDYNELASQIEISGKANP